MILNIVIYFVRLIIEACIMPLIKVQTFVSAPLKAEVETMLLSLSTKLAKHLGKS